MKLKYPFVIIIMLIFTVAVSLDILSTRNMASQASEQLLNSTAYFIGVALMQALNRTGIDEALFMDVIQKQPWENIAFIALYDQNGKTLLHSSQRMIGAMNRDILQWRKTHQIQPRSSYLTLKTGETVYILDIPLQMERFSQSLHVLRIALHTYPATRVNRLAAAHNLSAFFILGLLWIVSLSLLYYIHRVDKYQKREAQRQRLVELGEMSAVLAHEIRNPLGAIKGFAQLMKEENPSEVSIHEGCDVIIAESARLETLTHDLLIYARPGELALERFSIAELVDEVVRRFVADNPNLIINQLVELEQDIMYSDRHKIKQILINLAQNAIDASDKDQCVEIRATNQKNAICITVKDSGYGMDKATLEKAMTPFFTTKTKGTGLGLPIVQHLTQALNGTLAIESDNSKGTTVTATLPQLND